MDHKKACDIYALSKIIGLLNTLAAMRGASITDKLSLEIECAAERLDLFLGRMIDEVRANEEINFNTCPIEFESTPDQ